MTNEEAPSVLDLLKRLAFIELIDEDMRALEAAYQALVQAQSVFDSAYTTGNPPDTDLAYTHLKAKREGHVAAMVQVGKLYAYLYKRG